MKYLPNELGVKTTTHKTSLGFLSLHRQRAFHSPAPVTQCYAEQGPSSRTLQTVCVHEAGRRASWRRCAATEPVRLLPLSPHDTEPKRGEEHGENCGDSRKGAVRDLPSARAHRADRERMRGVVRCWGGRRVKYKDGFAVVVGVSRCRAWVLPSLLFHVLQSEESCAISFYQLVISSRVSKHR